LLLPLLTDLKPSRPAWPLLWYNQYYIHQNFNIEFNIQMYIEMDIIQFLLISVMHYFVRKV